MTKILFSITHLGIATLLFLPAVSFAAILTTDATTSTPVELASSCPVSSLEKHSLDITPDTGTYSVGDKMDLSVTATSPDCPIMTFAGQLEYNPNAIEVVSITPDASLVTHWDEPGIDKDLGHVTFSGMFASSTVLKNARLLFVIHAIPRRVGENIQIKFLNAQLVHPNDGNNVITGVTSGRKYRIVPKELGEPIAPVTPPVEEVASAGEVLGAATASPAVIVSSPTHPNQSAWYNASSSAFLFQFPGAVSSFRLGFDQKKDGDVRRGNLPVAISKEIPNLQNGIWFLHVSAGLSDGGTFEAGYQIQVDRTLPQNFVVKEVARSDNSDPDFTVSVSATDTYSGVDHYEFSLDGGAFERWESLTDGQFHRSVTTPGTHEVAAAVFDKAGNTLMQKLSFEVTYLPSPRIVLKQKEVSEGGALGLTIESESGATVDVSISRNGDSPTIEHLTLDATGKGEFESALTLSPGSYSVAAVAMSGRGAISKESERLGITVSSSVWGLMSRHPLIPVGVLVLLFFAAAGLFFFRRMQGGDGEEYIDEAEEAYVPAYEPVRSSREVPEIREAISSRGQVVLQPRARVIEVRLPPTRL